MSIVVAPISVVDVDLHADLAEAAPTLVMCGGWRSLKFRPSESNQSISKLLRFDYHQPLLLPLLFCQHTILLQARPPPPVAEECSAVVPVVAWSE